MQRDKHIHLARFISLIGRGTKIFFDRNLQPQGIRAGQLRILMALHYRDGLSQEHIRKLSNLDKATIAKTIKPLIDGGYLERKPNPKDKRAYKLSLTNKGSSVIPAVKQSMLSWADILTKGFSEEEKDLTHKLLERMAENVKKQLFDADNI